MAIQFIKAIGFVHNGKKYVFKVFQFGNNLIVKPYLNGKPVSCYSYSVRVDSTNIKDWEYYYGNIPPYVKLIEFAIGDIQKGYGIMKAIMP